MSNDPTKPSLALLVKLGSITVHADEMMSSDFHEYDISATRTVLNDPEVIAWIKKMDAMAFLPKKRDGKTRRK